MSQLCEEAIRAGALGFTTSRTYVHRTSRGQQIGTLRASTDEVLGIAAALRRAGTGVIQLISDAYQSTDDELVANEIELLGRIATEVGRPLSFTVQQNDDAPDRFREMLAAIDGWNAAGADVKAQVAVRPIGVLHRAARHGQPAHVLPVVPAAARLTPRRAARPRSATRSCARRSSPSTPRSTPSGFVGILHSGLRPHVPADRPARLRADAGRQRRRPGRCSRAPSPTSCSTTSCSTTTAAACSTCR